jgi:hypothetical protein
VERAHPLHERPIGLFTNAERHPYHRSEKAAVKRSKPQPSQDEPAAEGDDWVVCGGQRIWAAGFTEAGFPYGLTEEEFRQGNERYDSGAGWARAKRILEDVVRERAAPGAKVDVGYVKKIGGTLSRETYAAEVAIATGAKRHVAEIAALLRACRRPCKRATLRRCDGTSL